MVVVTGGMVVSTTAVVATALMANAGRKAVDMVVGTAEAVTETGIGSIVVVECAHGVVLVVGRGR